MADGQERQTAKEMVQCYSEDAVNEFPMRMAASSDCFLISFLVLLVRHFFPAYFHPFASIFIDRPSLDDVGSKQWP